MSGGSWDYAHTKLRQIADTLEGSNPELADHPLRVALRAHMHRLAEVCHSIEWSDSDDMLPGEWEVPARAFLNTCGDFPETGDSTDTQRGWLAVEWRRIPDLPPDSAEWCDYCTSRGWDALNSGRRAWITDLRTYLRHNNIEVLFDGEIVAVTHTDDGDVVTGPAVRRP